MMKLLAGAVPLRIAMSVILAVSVLSASCGPSISDQVNATAQPADPASPYCQAVQTLRISQPWEAPPNEALAVSMNLYADSLERFAALARGDDGLVLFEVAATARLVAVDPLDRVQVERLADLGRQASVITARGARDCGLGA